MNQLTENQPTFNSCNSSWPHIIFATNDQHSSSSHKCTSGLLHITGSNTMIFAVLKAWLMSPLHCVINWEAFYIDFLLIIQSKVTRHIASIYYNMMWIKQSAAHGRTVTAPALCGLNLTLKSIEDIKVKSEKLQISDNSWEIKLCFRAEQSCMLLWILALKTFAANVDDWPDNLCLRGMQSPTQHREVLGQK